MIEEAHNNELGNKKIILGEGTLEPVMNREMEKRGYRFRYTVRVPVSERGSDSFKESTYYLKPDSEDSKTGTIDRYVRVWDIEGDIYGMRPEVKAFPEGTTYQLEERENPENTRTPVLTLALPHKAPK